MRTPPRLDLALAAGLVALAVVETMGNDEAPHTILRTALAALTVSAVAIRRSHPVASAILFSIGMTSESLATEAPDELAVLVAMLLVSYAIGAHLPRREALLSGAVLCLSLTVTIATDPSDSISNIPLSIALFIAIPFLLGSAVRHRHRDVAELTLRADDLAREAVDNERRRIARELHDVVSHAVTLIAVQAEAGQAVIDDDPAAARRSLEAIGQVSREALDELARLLAVLDEDGATPESGLADLPALVEGVRATGMRVSLDRDPVPVRIDPDLDRCAYRVVQEALTNALRHTGGGQVDVRVRHADGGVDIEIRSEGRPHTSSYGGTGRGLAGLKERVLALGGTIDAGPDGGAFVVHAVLPDHA